MSTGRKVLFCLFAILFVGALTYGGLYIHSQREREKVYQDMETEKDSVEAAEEEEKVQIFRWILKNSRKRIRIFMHGLRFRIQRLIIRFYKVNQTIHITLIIR